MYRRYLYGSGDLGACNPNRDEPQWCPPPEGRHRTAACVLGGRLMVRCCKLKRVLEALKSVSPLLPPLSHLSSVLSHLPTLLSRLFSPLSPASPPSPLSPPSFSSRETEL